MTDNDQRDKGFVPPRYLMSSDIATRLLNTKTDKESFAIGITGSWGTGKSTFLEHLRDELKDFAFVIDFRPWDSQDSKQIINDFFCSVRDAVSPYYTPVSQPLVRYAQMLNGLDVHPLQRWLSERVISHYQDDIQNSKKNLSDCMSNLQKPVVVFIDDLDRLEADEAFEVLRLIRNTANLKNTYYIAAYDKNYLIGMLKSKGLPKAHLYLEKIFNLEVPLPVANAMDVANMFLADLNWMLSSLTVKYALEIDECLDLSSKRHLSLILGSFRQARRLARLMASQISTTRHIAELDYVDLLWLDLLQSTDYEVYVTLCHKPTEYLFLDKTDGTVNYHYELRNKVTDYKDGISECYDGVPLSDKVKIILSHLFCNKKRNKYSISYYVNYYRYFYLGVQNWQLMEIDFLFMLNCDEDRETQMLKHFTTKSPISVYHQFQCTEMGTDWKSIQRYLYVLFGWLQYQTYTDMPSLVFDCLRRYHFKCCDKDVSRKWIIERLEQTIDASSNYRQIAIVLERLYEEYDQEKIPESYPYISLIISVDDVADLIKRNFKKFLESENYDAADIVDSGTALGEQYRKTVVPYAHDEDGNRAFIYIGADVAITHFAQHKSMNYERFDKAFTIDSVFVDDHVYREAEQENIDSLIETLFGFNDKTDYYGRYSKECFIRPKKEYFY